MFEVDEWNKEDAELLKVRQKQLVKRGWKYEKIIGQLASEFWMGTKHIINVLNGSLPY